MFEESDLPISAALSGNVDAAETVVSRLNDGEARAVFVLRMIDAAEANAAVKPAAWAAFKIAWGARITHYELQRLYDPEAIAGIFALLAPQPKLKLRERRAVVTLYRGLRIPADQPPFIPWWRGVAWTTDLPTAAFFATTYPMNGDGAPAVVQMQIPRARIAWACDEEREFECVPDSEIVLLLDEPEAAAEEIGLRIEGRADLDAGTITDDDRTRWREAAARRRK